MGDPDWQRAAFIDGLHRIFVGALGEIAVCENPLYVTLQMAWGMAQVFHMVVYCWMERRGRTFEPPQTSDFRMQDYRGAVLCDIKDDRSRNVG